MYFPFLRYGCSLEINAARTASYLANRCDVCETPIGGTVDVRNSCNILNYDLDDAETAIVSKTYVSPTADAPWFDSSNSESARFLGFIISDVSKPTHIGRAVTQRISGSGGGVLETLRATAQVLEIEVFLFACDEAAMEYGFRYLTNSLADTGCDDGCTLCDLEYRDSCPDFTGTPTVDLFNQGRRILKNVGLVSAPEWVDPPVTGMEYFVRKAKFSLASELPWKFECAQVCTANEAFVIETPTLGCGSDFDTFFCADSIVSCAVSEPSLVGETGVIVDITAGTKPLSGIRIQFYPDQFGWACDPDSAPADFVLPDPCDIVYIEDLPTGYTITYDTSIERVYVTTNSGVQFDGTPYLSFDGIGGPPSYPTVKCGDFCVRIVVDECSVSTGAKATVQTVHREF